MKTPPKLFNDKNLSDLFGSSDITAISFIALSAIPIGAEVTSKYGTIIRESSDSFKIKMSESIISDKKEELENRVDMEDSVRGLFE